MNKKNLIAIVIAGNLWVAVNAARGEEKKLAQNCIPQVIAVSLAHVMNEAVAEGKNLEGVKFQGTRPIIVENETKKNGDVIEVYTVTNSIYYGENAELGQEEPTVLLTEIKMRDVGAGFCMKESTATIFGNDPGK